MADSSEVFNGFLLDILLYHKVRAAGAYTPAEQPPAEVLEGDRRDPGVTPG